MTKKELKFKSQICTTIEQSKRLLELGLNPETADCQYAALVIDWKGNPISSPKWRFYDHNKGFIVQNFEQMECIPAWSLHRLLSIGINGDYMGLWNININAENVEDLFEQLIRLIEWAIKDGAFNKEYLKQ